ncbi:MULTISPECIES: fatty acyl-AMP ligase [Streptomyces]|uniref:fatty acyl-AMP ligase n=1 Tax=Streptomyces TaxID=1883 RepID=UPI002249343D|nr:fatty acyl-AMP ligase [Streptomyces sp. JHD 1]MCX2970490.1 fatty acyl-AMP ligase [Streptomyces sp. JHD 1]
MPTPTSPSTVPARAPSATASAAAPATGSAAPAQAPAEPGSLDGWLRHWARERPDARAVTFVDFAHSARGTATTVSWAELERRTAAVAGWLAARVEPGARVAVLAPQGVDYLVAVLAAQRSGAVAVPLMPPGRSGHADRLAATFADCAPAAVLTTAAHEADVRELVAGLAPGQPAPGQPAPGTPDPGTPDPGEPRASRRTVPGRPLVVDVEAAAEEGGAAGHHRPAGHRAAAGEPEGVAYLQYTSGSTRRPTGAVIGHANVLANVRQVCDAYGFGPGSGHTVVSWLPLFHDMGLVLAVASPVVCGLHAVLMDPAAFLRRPGRWLRLLSTHPRTVTAAPNFAYDLAAARVGPEEKDWLRLDDVRVMINGAEPVRAATVERFQAAFAPCGLRPEAHRPSYGMAEATVLAAASRAGRPPRTTVLDREALAAGTARPPAAPEAGGVYVSCGLPAGQELRVVAPESGTPLPPGRVGELWLRGPNVARGYWNPDEEGRRAFAGTLPDDAGGPWLRTGDLGVLHEGELYVTGRLKDLVIVGGRNHYPQDLELTAEQAHAAVRPHHVAAFAVPAPTDAAGDPGERLVLVAETARAGQAPPAEVAAAVRGAVSARHGVAAHDVRLLPPGSVPRTSSGKVARAAARRAYLAGAYDEAGAHDEARDEAGAHVERFAAPEAGQ